MARVIDLRFSTRLLAVIALAAFCSTALAQQKSGDHAQPKPGKGPTYTEPPKNDPNYKLLGEFVGTIKTGEEGKESEQLLGLQIRPIAGNNFEAVSFIGGLPGQEKHQPEPVKMIGRRSADFVILSGGPHVIVVEKEHCLLIDREGNKLGRLERTHRESPTMHAPPPEGSVVLFDGTNVDQFTTAQMTKDGLLTEGANIKPMFDDFDMHVEFLIPYMPHAQGQSRGNSGVYLQGRYECQVLDSFALDPLINGLGALYQFRKPNVNMALPPLVWQTYDIHFTAPRWAADGSKIRNAHITSWINGIKVQDNVELPNKTGAGMVEEPRLLPTRLQNHRDPVRFRNIWVIDRGLTPHVEFPVRPTQEQLEAAKAKIEQAKKAKEVAEKAQEEAKKAAEEAKKKEAEKKAAADKQSTETNEEMKKKPEASQDVKPEPQEKKPDDSGEKPTPAKDSPAKEPAPENNPADQTGEPTKTSSDSGQTQSD